jgi:DNA-binding NtrC family response regulator
MGLCQNLKERLFQLGYKLSKACDKNDVLRALKFIRPALIVLGSSLTGDWDGLELAEQIRRTDRTIPLILINVYSCEERAIAALRAGVNDYFKTPISYEEVVASISRMLAGFHQTSSANIPVHSNDQPIIGDSLPIQEAKAYLMKAAATDCNVLISGETGTGKELVARAIHRRSGRSSRAFVSVNCAAVPRDLIASELFGHEKGSFTGASHRRLGRFELAEGGTIFLDEVGELPAETQIALLRVLQEHEFDRVGGTGSIRTNVRVIAATNRDLEAAIASGVFRRDLFYRLNVFPIEMPPLRERGEDIPLLVEYFIDRFARQAGKSFRAVNKKSLDLLQRYSWPGNIRELQNVIERSVIVCETDNFSVDESWLSRPSPSAEANRDIGLLRRLPSQEKAIIEAALRESGGRVYGPAGAAAKLGMPRSTLEHKIRSLRINKNRFKTGNPSESS